MDLIRNNLWNRNHHPAGEIFKTAHVHDAAEAVNPAVTIQVNRTIHPALIRSGVDAGGTLDQTVVGGVGIHK